ncbi:ABC transporter permease [Pseudochelatococcus contaminans]|uniref:Peptide/nickel transport system permease protein n=1 Tax=Pseudochelatococcus contaminans TaxID=1538103 RepID=A0A7W5Z591_9HYPH|nr:ABC transporter permease [Pseudochelatococcus contaminans]MBB3810224.1 peptide/nickel transport system permease protein [Pseudochelatococcus contaminans]
MSRDNTNNAVTNRLSARPKRLSVAVILSVVFLVLIAIQVLFPEAIATHSPITIDPLAALQPPSREHWFGTDNLGRDLFSRVVHGSAYSVSIGFGATLIALAGGIVFGALAGFGGRWLDQALMRFNDVLMALPSILLALVVVALLGTGLVNTLWAIGIGLIPQFARLVRAEVLVVRNAGYVESAVGFGFSKTAVVCRHVIPNAIHPVFVLATISIGGSILAGSTLSFLKLGPQPPAPEWGLLLSEGRSVIEHAWWLGVFPGIAISLTVLSVTVVGKSLQKRYLQKES